MMDRQPYTEQPTQANTRLSHCMEDPLCANIQDKEGNTALHLACQKEHKRTVNTLLVRKLEVLANLA